VTVKGLNFLVGKTTFKFGTAKATSVNCTSSTQCTMLSPAHTAGTVDVVATANKLNSPVVAGDKYSYS
jgi:N-acetylmuramic acid 6-phosphate (MurNAc-6-P) etherase